MTNFISALKGLAPYLGFLTALLGILWVAVKYLLIQWFEGQKKIKEMEAREVLSSVADLSNKIDDHRKQLGLVATLLASSREELIAIKTRLDVNIKNEDQFIRHVDQIREHTDTRLRSVESSLDDGEILKIGTNRFMFKGRKKSQD